VRQLVPIRPWPKDHQAPDGQSTIKYGVPRIKYGVPRIWPKDHQAPDGQSTIKYGVPRIKYGVPRIWPKDHQAPDGQSTIKYGVPRIKYGVPRIKYGVPRIRICQSGQGQKTIRPRMGSQQLGMVSPESGSWNHAEDTVPRQRATAKRPNRVGDSDSTT
jgi:hypothetical protein